MAGVGRARLWFTDRHGPDGSGRPRVQQPLPSRYGDFNLGDHVGDVPADVDKRRRRLAANPVAFMEQVHGRGVAVLTSHPDAPIPATDALVTSARAVPLAVLVADCLPVLMYEPKVEIIGCAHAGRRGIEVGILGATLDAIESCGGSRSDVVVTIGPSIGPCCYEVPAQLRASVCDLVPEAWATTRWGTPSVDLRSAALSQLRAVGVTDIQISGICTYESDRHYSYRRDGVTGRFAGVIVLPEDSS